MSSRPLLIAINWYGPYTTIEAARKAARDDYNDGLYIALGKRSASRNQMDYIGISKNLGNRLSGPHHTLSKIKLSQIWLGEVVTAEPSGKKMKVTKTTLDYAEWLHAHFMALPYNDKKTLKPPSRPVTVLNRWWKCDYETPRRNRPHPDWPDLIDHPMHGQHSRTVWFGKRQKLFDINT